MDKEKESTSLPVLPQPIQFPPLWNEISYGSIRIASNTEDLGTLVRHLKKIVELEHIQKRKYIG